MTCIACHDMIGEHSFNKLGKCLVRVQGTLDIINKKRGDSETPSKGESEGKTSPIDTSHKDIGEPANNLNDLVQENIGTSDGVLGYYKDLYMGDIKD